MKKVLVFGAGGMAGHVVSEYFSSLPEYEVIRCARRKVTPDTVVLDVTDFDRVKAALREVQPTLVINCIGMLVAASRDHVDQAILINSYFPNFLSKIGDELGFKFIHISTDCVFSGKKGQYSETDFRDGNDAYARSKALGEVINDRDLTIRTSIIGPEIKTDGTGLFDWFMKQSGTIKGYSNAFWSGVTTIELAKFLHRAIGQDLSGLYQLSSSGKICKYDLLEQFKLIWERDDIDIDRFSDYHCDKSLVCTRSDFSWEVPDYSIMLAEMKQWMDAHPDNYIHYKQ